MVPNALAADIPAACRMTKTGTKTGEGRAGGKGGKDGRCPLYFRFKVGDSQDWIRTPSGTSGAYLTHVTTKTKLYCNASQWGWVWDGDNKAFDCT